MQAIRGSYIEGSWYFDDQLPIKSIQNPANITEMVGQVQWADIDAVGKALMSAESASKNWRKSSLKTRLDYIQNLLKKIWDRKEEFAKIITSENGKTIKESTQEIQASIDESKFHIDYIVAHQTETFGNTQLRYEPLGVVLAITPWNFPLATILRKLVPGLLTGNTVIVKPSELTPLTAIALFDMINEVGFPKGVVNLLVGNGATVGKTLVKSPLVKAISFTGADRTGQMILNDIAGRDVRFQAEMGGSNAVVVMNDANLDEVVPDIISNGFSCCGQWCTGTSRVIVENGVHDKVIERLKKETEAIVYGDGTNSKTMMGPLSNQKQYDTVSTKIKRALKEGAILECGGMLNESGSTQGWYVKPTVLSSLTDSMKIAQEEVFGPVLMVFKADDFNHAIKLVNDNPYGLSVSIYTQNKAHADHFIEEVDSGLVHVNLPTAHREYAMPLMGWKNSGMGTPECGRFMLDLFTKPKVIYRK